MNPFPFTYAEALAAAQRWRFNCGPAAICAVLGMKPEALRPQLFNFEQKGYMNPTMVQEALEACGAQWEIVYRSDRPVAESGPKTKALLTLENALVRVQWSGPWTKPGVPPAAAYQQTHWIAARNDFSEVFDVNALEVRADGWISKRDWESQVVPLLLPKRGDGHYWPTHAIEVKAKC